MIKTALNLLKNTHKKILKTTTTDHSGKATLLALSKMNITGGPKDLSQNLDKYLYKN
ncbi:MAG: hypothetical protein WCW27_02730 [Patescibacteria group bacterium]|jgi:hypothetical protein